MVSSPPPCTFRRLSAVLQFVHRKPNLCPKTDVGGRILGRRRLHFPCHCAPGAPYVRLVPLPAPCHSHRHGPRINPAVYFHTKPTEYKNKQFAQMDQGAQGAYRQEMPPKATHFGCPVIRGALALETGSRRRCPVWPRANFSAACTTERRTQEDTHLKLESGSLFLSSFDSGIQ